METKTAIKATIIATAAVVGIFTVSNLQDPNARVKEYIKQALINGCRPVLDICTANCTKDIIYPGPEACLPAEILRTTPKQAVDSYVELARELNVGFNDTREIPYKVRAELGKTNVLESLKESLSLP